MTIIDIASSVASFILSHDEFKTKQNYEIYNAWATEHGIILKDLSVIQWVLNYINDIKDIPSTVIADAINAR